MIVTSQLAFAGMQTGPHFYPESSHDLINGGGTANGTRRTVERDEKPVSGVFDFSTAKSTELIPGDSIMGIQEGAPALISQRCGSFG